MENQNRKNIVHKFLENPTWSGSTIVKMDLKQLPGQKFYVAAKRGDTDP